MNRYTIELHYIEEDLGYNLFNENFPFYEPALREQFVKKFYDKYRFREIGSVISCFWKNVRKAL